MDENKLHEKFPPAAGSTPALYVDENDLHEKFVEYGMNAKEWTRKCVLLLPEIDRRFIWRKKGFLSIYEYAAKLAGMSHHTVDDALRILKKVENKPKLREVIERKGINAVRPVAAIATPETDLFWAEKAGQMSKNTLEVYVREFRGLSCTSTESQPEKITISMDLDPEIAQKLEKLKGRGDWNTLMKEFLRMRVCEKPVPIETASSRHIPAEIAKYSVFETHGTCAFPGCNKPYQALHHPDRYSAAKNHKRIVPLCRAHHNLAHLGLIENERFAPEKWRIRLGAAHQKYRADKIMAGYLKPP